jgi:hypothetical protein
LRSIAFVCLMLRIDMELRTARGSVESLAEKVGTVLLILDGMHFFNLYVFTRLRQWRASHTGAA